MFAAWLNNFQFKDKLEMIAALKEERNHRDFEIAVQQFVDGFQQSYSVDAPYPKRVGRWVGLYAPVSVIESLLDWSASVEHLIGVSKYRVEFRSALEVAREIDRSTRPQMMDAA